MVNLAILKLFINDKKQLHYRRKEKSWSNANLNLNEHQVISQHIEKVETDSLDMITDNTPEMTRLQLLLRQTLHGSKYSTNKSKKVQLIQE